MSEEDTFLWLWVGKKKAEKKREIPATQKQGLKGGGGMQQKY